MTPPEPETPDGRQQRQIPDPTVLVTEAIDRAITAFTQTMDARLDGLSQKVDAQRAYFEAILDEQRRGVMVAEQEREKSAKALALEMSRSIEEGDRNLREHITLQVHQIREALDSADKLELARYETLDQKLRLITNSAAEAIAKAEDAFEKRFAAADAHSIQLAAEVAKALPREVAETQIADLRRAFGELSDKVNKIA